MDGFNVVLKLCNGLMTTVWEPPLKVVRRHAITVLFLHRGDGPLVSVTQPLLDRRLFILRCTHVNTACFSNSKQQIIAGNESMDYMVKERMVQHTWKRLDIFPLTFAVVFATGVFLPCIIALSYGHVTPYIPYISEGGGFFPEAGIFSICISLSAIICQCIIILRYLVIEELNTLIGKNSTGFLNKIGLALGGLSSLTLIIVASYPTSTISQVHNSAAGVTCVSFLVYLICHTLISFRIMGRSKMAYFRMVITMFCGICLTLISTFGLIASSLWTADYWSGKKEPGDKGFEYYVVSSCSEWIMAFLIVLFLTTYIFEFKKSTFRFQIEITTTRNKPTLSNLDHHHR